jgi:hypothetical protein
VGQDYWGGEDNDIEYDQDTTEPTSVANTIHSSGASNAISNKNGSVKR